MSRILVVDDDPQVRALVRRALERLGYEVIDAENVATARRELEEHLPDLLVLDIMLPDASGTDFCREVRAQRSIPIIFLSGLSTEVDRIVGLELGADDYLSKPFHPGELVARVKAVLRRAAAAAAESTPPARTNAVKVGPLVLDLQRHSVAIHSVDVELTKTEFMFLRTLMRHPNKVYTRDDLMYGVYGPATYVADRTINSHMRRLRSKLHDAGFDPVETVRGVGYRIRKLE